MSSFLGRSSADYRDIFQDCRREGVALVVTGCRNSCGLCRRRQGGWLLGLRTEQLDYCISPDLRIIVIVDVAIDPSRQSFCAQFLESAIEAFSGFTIEFIR